MAVAGRNTLGSIAAMALAAALPHAGRAAPTPMPRMTPDISWLHMPTGTLIGSLGEGGTAPGQYSGPHLIATDSKGMLYVAEVRGRRLQRLMPIG